MFFDPKTRLVYVLNKNCAQPQKCLTQDYRASSAPIFSIGGVVGGWRGWVGDENGWMGMIRDIKIHMYVMRPKQFWSPLLGASYVKINCELAGISGN